MNPIVWNGLKLVFGLEPLKAISGAPPGAQRIRLRAKQVARLRVITPEGIREFLLEDKGDHWEPGPETGCNVHKP